MYLSAEEEDEHTLLKQILLWMQKVILQTN